MLRDPLPAPPDPATLAERLVHVVTRDYPETLAVFRRHGVDVPRRGGVAVREAVRDDAGPLLDALADSTAWRNARR